VAVTEPVVVWLTGLSGSGKTTLARALCEELSGCNLLAQHVDGDQLRRVVGCPGFSRPARDQNVATAGYAASLLQRHGVNVVVSLISPYDAARKLVRSMCEPFVLVHVSTPLEVCIARDPKGLYSLASFGLIPNFTGVTDPYEVPDDAELTLDTEHLNLDDATDMVLRVVQTASSSRANR